MAYSVSVLADSVAPIGVRLTSLSVTFPRFLLAEVNTHRSLSRNSASSRAIPTEKLIEQVRENPFVPETFNQRIKGMGVGDPLDGMKQEACRQDWLWAAEKAAQAAERLCDTGIDKSRANRLLEPFLWHTAIISATEWENFFALRDHPDAQPEFQIIARMMREAIEDSEPQSLDYGQWHLPMLTEDELSRLWEYRDPEICHPLAFADYINTHKLISAGRLARVSFDTHDNFELWNKSIERAKMLMSKGHYSPFEHVATPMATIDFFANYRCWMQMRYEIPNQHNFALARSKA